jgi:hypothetical protein
MATGGALMAIKTLPPPEEVGRRGEAIYEENLRDVVETDENIGKFISIDIYSGDYEIGTDRLDLADRLTARHPDAEICAMKIGYTSAVSMGGGFRRRPPRSK